VPKPTSKTGKPRPQRWQLSGRHAYLIIASNRLGEHVVVIDRRDLGLVGQYRWWLHRSNRLIYATAYVGGQRVRMHKLLLPGAALVDHRDGNSLNNVRRNLRPADRSINTFNSERPTGRAASGASTWIVAGSVPASPTKVGAVTSAGTTTPRWPRPSTRPPPGSCTASRPCQDVRKR
jgi:hypothetical protein